MTNKIMVNTVELKIINLDPAILKADVLKRILEDAGRWYGIGDYRPEFGLFKVVKFKVVDDDTT